MTDIESKRNSLKLSYRLLSYLEKHRISELFQELSMMLLIKKPKDHVLFLKQSIYHAAQRLDAPRIIIFAPPGCDKLQLAGTLREKLQIPLITLNDIVSNQGSSLEINSVIENLRMLLMHYMDMNSDGWILLDFPTSDKEARCLQRSGIIPSHVIEIISTEKVYCTPNKSNCSTLQFDYYREIRGIRRVFSKVIKTIEMKNKTIENVAQQCLNLFTQRNYLRASTILRILLFDFVDVERGKCLGLCLSNAFNISYIDFNAVLKQVCLQETELANQLRKIGNFVNLPLKLKIDIFEQFLIESEALKKGWLLIGFVNTVDDFKQLDLTDFPPNRVIMIVPEESISNIKSETLTSCTNLNSLTYNSSNNASDISSKQFICECDKTIQEIIDYAGNTAFIVENHEKFDFIKEKIQTYLTLPPPCVPPRMSRSPAKIHPENIELDPDDEPSVSELKFIRQPEPILPLI